MQFDSLCVKKQGELYATGEETGNRGMLTAFNGSFFAYFSWCEETGRCTTSVQHLYNICITSKETGDANCQAAEWGHLIQFGSLCRESLFATGVETAGMQTAM